MKDHRVEVRSERIGVVTITQEMDGWLYLKQVHADGEEAMIAIDAATFWPALRGLEEKVRPTLRARLAADGAFAALLTGATASEALAVAELANSVAQRDGYA